MKARCFSFFILSFLVLAGLSGFPREGAGWAVVNGLGQEEIEVISLQSLAEDPAPHLGKTYRISGSLKNKGRNYFTDLRLVLEDAECNFVYVRPWLPLEYPPPPPGRPDLKKAGLSFYLEKEVELTATVERGSLKVVGEVTYLSVKSAKILDKNTSL